VLIKISEESSLQQFLPLSEPQIHRLLHPLQATVGYFLA
jgi:hypothetical protein